jgi:crossover junction endodeoxyribonuclease RuvC
VKVLGLDPSLNSAGGAEISSPGALAALFLWKPPAKLRGPERMAWHLDQLAEVAGECDLVLIEGIAGSGVLGVSAHLELAGLHWVIRHWLHKARIPCAVVQPSLRQMYLTGKGNAKKEDCLLAAERRWPDVGFTGTDDADAYTLAHMGADWLGFAPVQMPADRRAVLTRIVPAKSKKPAHPAIEWPAHLKEKLSA